MKISKTLTDNKNENGSIFFYFSIFVAAIIFYPLVKELVNPVIVNSFGIFMASLVFGFLYYLFSIVLMLIGMERNPITALYEAFVAWIIIGLLFTFFSTIDPIFHIDKQIWLIVDYAVAAISSWGILTSFNYWKDDKMGIIQITIVAFSLMYFFYNYTMSHKKPFDFFSHLIVLLH